MISRTIPLTGVCFSLILIATGSPSRAADKARLDTLVTPAGEGYFALSLTPESREPKRRPHDVAIVFDTSASQSGSYRDKALAALHAFLAALGPNDRVLLIAADVNAVPLSKAFVPPASNETRGALAALESRVPLGSTDMPAVLDGILTVYRNYDDEGRDRAAVYLGDGLSPGNLVTPARMRVFAEAFVSARIPVTSYAIGPRADLPLLGAVAKNSGGMLLVDSDQLSADEVGRELAADAGAAVVWPRQLQLPEGFQSVYYRGAPPLRFDRDAVILGTMRSQAAAGTIAVSLDGTLAGQPVSLRWKVDRATPGDDCAGLAQLVDFARRDGGVTLPTAGGVAFDELRQLVNIQTRNLVKLGQQAVATGDLNSAEKLVAEAARRDPDNQGALILRRAVTRAKSSAPRASTVALSQAAPPRRAGAAAEEPLPPEAAGESPDDSDAGDLLNQVEQQQRVMEGFLRAEVRDVLNQARRDMSIDPQGTSDRLKLALDKLRWTTDLSPEVRSQLEDRLQAALREASRLVVVKTERDLQRQVVAAEGEARERINRELFLQQQKVDQLMARFGALMDEERYRDAEALADIAEEIEPGRPGLRGAELTARMVGYQADTFAVLDMRRKGFVDALFQIELSHVPTADEPPILYPDPEVWQLLTERRKKYSSVDLTQHGPTETRILAALDEKTDLDFAEQPLSDVIEYLQQRHDINIQLDQKALSDAGVGSDTPITRNLKGITLRSALKMLLSELDLTYVIRNEVLMITSKTEAENMLSTRVYPVADLVTPIPQLRMGGRGMF